MKFFNNIPWLQGFKCPYISYISYILNFPYISLFSL